MARRFVPDASDDLYQIPLGDHYSSLSEENRQKIVACIPRESCRRLAERLLPDAEINAALNRQDVPYPASEIMDVWGRKRHSTIYILKDTLGTLQLDGALRELDTARYDYITIYATISGDIRKFNNVPSHKPLNEIIRPYIHRQQGMAMIQRGSIQVLQLIRTSDYEQELTWSSPAKHFKGQQIIINVEVRKSEKIQRHTDKAGNLEGQIRVERNVISWIENDSMFFEYQDIDPESTRPVPPDPLGKAVEESCRDSSGIGLASRLAEMSLGDRSTGEDNDHRGNTRKDQTPATTTPTTCQCFDLSTEDTLREHLTHEGDFVVQQIQAEGNKKLNLNVRHKGRILQYPIETESADGEEHFSISGLNPKTSDVQQLLDHYQTNGHHLPHLPSLPPTQVEDDLVYLGRNRTVSIVYSHRSSQV